MTQKSGETLVYVGSYKASDGIYAYRFDVQSGRLEQIGHNVETPQPLYIAVHPQRDAIYAVHGAVSGREVKVEGRPDGAVSALSFNRTSGAMTLLNTQPSRGQSPCYVSVDVTGQVALVANYDGGSVTALPIVFDRSLGAPSDFHQHEGSSIDPKRQTKAYAHAIAIDPSGKWAIAADLGIDKLMVYELAEDRGRIPAAPTPWARSKAGSGPRHIAFHPGGRYMYVIHELNSTMVAYEFDNAVGVLTELQSVPTVPAAFTAPNYCADIHIGPSGRFVYGSNRGHDSIVAYAIDQKSGRLSSPSYMTSGGKTPRAFGIDPTGRFLLSANLASDSVTVFRIDVATGKLEPSGQVVSVPSPGCLTVV
ncbi:MAG: lactonase family protein [SAR202 cluster bacterium]|nr:lactonase family protein [SAR202 cluster bacterium]